MIYAILGSSVVSFTLGYIVATWVVARDADLIRLRADQLIVQKPKEGLVLAAVTPEVLRRVVNNPQGYEAGEARAIYKK